MCPDGVTMVPGYYGRSIALREFALLNPLTYANTELTVGAYSPYPTTQIVNLPGLCFERGAIALVCAIGIEVLAISLLCVAGKSGCACPISPICLERGSFTASRTATRSSACASAVAYVRTMGNCSCVLLPSPYARLQCRRRCWPRLWSRCFLTLITFPLFGIGMGSSVQ